MPSLYDHYKANRAWHVPPARAMEYAQRDKAAGRKCRLPPHTAPWDRRPVEAGTVLRCPGRTFVVAIVPDNDMGPPWEEHDGHGPVSEWTSRAKRPGERELCSDRGSQRYYDFAEAVRIARKDGWGPAVPGETKRQQAARAVEADFERLWRWCANHWHWTGVVLFELPRDGMMRDALSIAEQAPFGVLRHWGLWGIESDATPEYVASVAYDLLADAMRERA